MAEQRQPPNPVTDAPTRTDGAWTEEEKLRGAGAPGQDAGAADGPSTKGRPTDDRARTEGVAADIEGAPAEQDPPSGAPDPTAPVGGGQGARSMGGSAADPQ